MTVDGDVGAAAQFELPPIWRAVVVVGLFGLLAALKPLSWLVDRILDSRAASWLRARRDRRQP